MMGAFLMFTFDFSMTVDDGNHIVLLTDKVGHLVFYHFSLVIGIENLLSSPLAHCGHLWPGSGLM